MAGEGANSKLGVRTETTPGTAVGDPTSTLPFISASFSAPKELIPSETIGGDSMVAVVQAGVQAASGSITQEFDAETAGQMLFYANGDNGYTDEGATTDGQITTAPTATAGSSGASIAAGDYIYKVAAVIEWTVPGIKFILPASAASTAETVTSGQEVALSWTDPTGLTLYSDEYTYAGTAIYRSETDGAAGTCTFLHYVSGTGNSWTDTGADTYADTNVSPVGSTTLYEHTFVGAAPASGQPRLKSFTAQFSKNVTNDERYLGCQVDEFTLDISDANSSVTSEYSILAMSGTTNSGEFSASAPTIRRQIMGYQATVDVNGTANCDVQSFSLSVANGAEYQYGLCNQAGATKIAVTQNRQVTGSVSLIFQNQTLLEKALNGEEISLKLYLYGEPILANGGTLTAASHSVSAIPMPRVATFDMQRVVIGEFENPVDGPGQIIATFSFQAFKDSVTATDLTIEMINTTSAYS